MYLMRFSVGKLIDWLIDWLIARALPYQLIYWSSYNDLWKTDNSINTIFEMEKDTGWYGHWSLHLVHAK